MTWPFASSHGEGEVVHVGDGLDRVMETIAPLAAVAQELVVLQPADDVFHPGTDPAVLGVVVLLDLQQGPSRAFAMRYRHPAVEIGAVAQHGHSLAVPAQPGRPPGMGNRGRPRHRPGGRDHQPGSVSTMTCTFAENR